MEPTAAYFACKKACEPIHILLNPLTETVEAVNWYSSPAGRFRAEAELIGMDGRLLWTGGADIDLAPDETVSCFPVAYPEDRPEVCFVRLVLTSSDGTPVSENVYWRGKEEGNLQALRSMPPATLRGSVWRSAEGEETVLDLHLENTGTVPALMLQVEARDSSDGDLIVPVLYSDNYLFLMPGGRKDIRIRMRREDIRGKAEVTVSGFNLVGPIKISEK